MSGQIEHKLKGYIEEHQLLEWGDEVVIGVSGGADSMMLFHYLYTHKEQYGIRIKVAHINHGIRQEAEADALYVETVCQEWDVPFYRHDCNIKQIAKEKRLSEEEAGREERYNFFISLLNQNGKIATAHNMNDQAETLIMRFIRGTDIKGLGGIVPKRESIIRPLLCLTRTEIEQYCKSYNLLYKDDHTNFLPIYMRNKVRLKCIPYIEQELNSGVVRTLGEHSELYREEEEFLKLHSQELFEICSFQEQDKLSLDIHKLEKYHSYMQKRVIMIGIQKMIKQTKDITSKHIDAILSLIKGQSGKEVHLPYGLIIKREYESLIFTEQVEKAKGYCYQLKLGKQFIPEANLEIELILVEDEGIEQKAENVYTKYIY